MIACGAIYLAGRVLQRALPEDPPWWTLFDTKTEGLSGSFGASTEAFCFALLTDILVVFFQTLFRFVTRWRGFTVDRSRRRFSLSSLRLLNHTSLEDLSKKGPLSKRFFLRRKSLTPLQLGLRLPPRLPQ